MLQYRPKHTLDRGDYHWLKARHHFIVSPNGNLDNRPLGNLIVWNDDEIAPGTGFGLHRHADMEIITYVRQAPSHTRTVSGTSAGPRQATSR